MPEDKVTAQQTPESQPAQPAKVSPTSTPKKKNTKLMLLALLSLLIVIIVSGLGLFFLKPKLVSKSGPITLTLWYHSALVAPEGAVLQNEVKKFNASQKEIVINPIVLPEGDYDTYIENAFKTGKFPDILDIDGPLLYQYAARKQIAPLDPYVSTQLKANLLPSIIDQGTYNNHLYGIGQFDSGLGIWGNKALLEKAGIRIPLTAKDPWSKEEFANALALLKKEKGVTYPLDISLSYGSSEWLPYGFLPVLQSYGGDVVNKDNMKQSQGYFNSTASVQAMTDLQQWYKQGYILPANGTDTFKSGTIGLSFVGHWMWADYKKALGDNLVLLPMPNFKIKPVTAMGSWVWTITAQSKYPEQAGQFIKYLMKDENIGEITNANGAIPATYTALALNNNYKPGGSLEIYVKQLETIAVARPKTEYYSIISGHFRETFLNIINGGDVKKELTDAAIKIETDIAKQAQK